MNSLGVIAKKELKDFTRNRFFLVLFGFLVIVIVLSVVVAALDFRTKIGDYNLYLSALKSSGGSATGFQPQLFVLQLLRGGIEYIELIGALFAIIIGYGVIAKEKYRGTLPLLFSRPLGKFSLGGGKVIALAVLWFSVVTGIFLVVLATLVLIGNASLSSGELAKLAITALLAWIYLCLWSFLAMGLAAVSKHLSSALIIALVLWLVFVLIVPQIGDTMDPDNQVPGGLFKSLQVDKAHEQSVTDHFTGYEKTRNIIEISSITKHYERASFAYLGIADEYNQQPIIYIWRRTFANSLWLVVGLIVSMLFAVGFTTKRMLLRKEL